MLIEPAEFYNAVWFLIGVVGVAILFYWIGYDHGKNEEGKLMFNKVLIIGRLTKDPDLKYTPSGIPVSRFTVAANRNVKNDQNQQQDKTDFINCVAWRKTAENLANYQKKGSLIHVEGRIETGSYDGQDGKKIYTTDIVAEKIQFLEPRDNKQAGSGQQQPPQNQYQQEPRQQGYQQNYPNYQQPPQQQYQQPNNQQQQYQAPSSQQYEQALPYNDDLPFR